MKNDRIIYDGELTKEEKEELAKQYFITEEKQTKLGGLFIVLSLIALSVNVIATCIFYPVYAEDTLYHTFVSFLKDADIAAMTFILQFIIIAVIVLKIALAVSSVVCGITLRGVRAMIGTSACIIAFIDLLFTVLQLCDPNTYHQSITVIALIINAVTLLLMCGCIYMTVFTDNISKFVYSKKN